MEEVDRHSFDLFPYLEDHFGSGVDVDNGLVLDVLGTIGVAEGIKCFLRIVSGG